MIVVHILGSKRRITAYYKRQEKLLENYNEMDSFIELGRLPGSLTEVCKLTLSKFKILNIVVECRDFGKQRKIMCLHKFFSYSILSPK